MRSRAIREGSVGLLALIAVGIFGGTILWLSGVKLGNRGYSFTTKFDDANGMKLGSPVVYRGVTVGRISEITTSSNGVVVKIEIDRADLVISIDSAIEVNQSGLIGETSVAIVPKTELDTATLQANPLASDCNRQVIICDGSNLEGKLGVSFNQLLQGTLKVSNLYTSDEFFENINVLAKNASDAAEG
ncbi:MAG: MCE family protein, partial [Coleofasciculaceae cyanobacterium SM2_1_6]|nr:MCE family protein [Coleofasciculaceae cyanobacterium SM2_1_6]